MSRNESKVVDLRDGAKVTFETGMQFLRIFKEHPEAPSVFTFFEFMDNREKSYILPRRNPAKMGPTPVPIPVPGGLDNMVQQGPLVPGMGFEEIHLVKDESQGGFQFERGPEQWRNRPYQDNRYPRGPGNMGYYGPRRGGSGYGGPRGDNYSRGRYNNGNGGRFPYRRGGPQQRYERKGENGDWKQDAQVYESYEPKEIMKQGEKKKKNLEKKSKENEPREGGQQESKE